MAKHVRVKKTQKCEMNKGTSVACGGVATHMLIGSSSITETNDSWSIVFICVCKAHAEANPHCLTLLLQNERSAEDERNAR